MFESIGEFVAANSSLCIVSVTLLAAVGLTQWRRVRIVELELAAKREWIDQGVSAADIQILLGNTSTSRRGWIDQFGQLSGGAKAGVITAFVLVAVPIGTGVISLMANYHFWRSMHEQQRVYSQSQGVPLPASPGPRPAT